MYTRPDDPPSSYYVQAPFTATTKPKDGSPGIRVQLFIQLRHANHGNQKADGTDGWDRRGRGDRQRNSLIDLGPRPRRKFFVYFVYFDENRKCQKSRKDSIEGPYAYAQTFGKIPTLIGSHLFPQFFIEIFFEVWKKVGVTYDDVVKSVYKDKLPPSDILDPLVHLEPPGTPFPDVLHKAIGQPPRVQEDAEIWAAFNEGKVSVVDQDDTAINSIQKALRGITNVHTGDLPTCSQLRDWERQRDALRQPGSTIEQLSDFQTWRTGASGNDTEFIVGGQRRRVQLHLPLSDEEKLKLLRKPSDDVGFPQVTQFGREMVASNEPMYISNDDGTTRLSRFGLELMVKYKDVSE